MARYIAMAAAAALAVGTATAASAADQAAAGKKEYLLTTTHTPEQCLAALDEMAAKSQKLLAKTEWGCKAGDHTGYVFVEAKDEAEALAMLPEANRATAKAVAVTRFTPKQLKEIHEMMAKPK